MPELIDVHDLPEEKAEFVQKLVEFLRKDEETKKKEKTQRVENINFLSKRMGNVKGTLSRKEMYDF